MIPHPMKLYVYVIAYPRRYFPNRATRIEKWSWHIGGPDLVSFAPVSVISFLVPFRYIHDIHYHLRFS